MEYHKNIEKMKNIFIQKTEEKITKMNEQMESELKEKVTELNSLK